jgi:hypothetical protein
MTSTVQTSVSDPDSIRSENPDPDSESGSGSMRAKMTHKNIKKFRNRNFMLEVLDVLFWGLKASPVAWKSRDE